MTRILREQRLSLTGLAADLGVSPATVWRWCLRGSNGHRLESVLLGSRRYTSREALDRFVGATNGGQIAIPTTPTAACEAAAMEANRRLQELGA